MRKGNPALDDPRLETIEHEVVRHGSVGSLQAAAEARGVPESAIVKTMVVRISEDEFVFVLVPGDRAIDWPKLRNLLGVNRLSLPDEETALAVTGYVRGTITPFGASRRLPVVADNRVAEGMVSIGGGERGVALNMAGNDLVDGLGARVADLTKPARPLDPERKASSPQ